MWPFPHSRQSRLVSLGRLDQSSWSSGGVAWSGSCRPFLLSLAITVLSLRPSLILSHRHYSLTQSWWIHNHTMLNTHTHTHTVWKGRAREKTILGRSGKGPDCTLLSCFRQSKDYSQCGRCHWLFYIAQLPKKVILCALFHQHVKAIYYWDINLLFFFLWKFCYPRCNIAW